MRMTIDKAIAKIWHCIVSIRDCVGNKEFVEALELSVDIMRKYQKIVEIYQWAKDRSYLVEADDIMTKLSEVLEDGNDN